MARVSRFRELDIFNSADVHPAQTSKPCEQVYPKAGKTLKSVMKKPFHGLCTITRCYMQHLNLMASTSTTSEQSQNPDVVEAGSTACDLESVYNKKVLDGQLNYVFGVQPDTSMYSTASTKTENLTPPPPPPTRVITPTDQAREITTLDVREIFNKAYTCTILPEIKPVDDGSPPDDFSLDCVVEEENGY